MIELGYVGKALRPHETHEPRTYADLREAYEDLWANPQAVAVPDDVDPETLKKQSPCFTAAVIPRGERVVKENVKRLHLLVVDLDDIPKDNLEDLLERLEGLEFVFYTSWKDGKDGPDAPYRCRLVFSLSRAVETEEWLDVWQRARSALGVASWMDAQCKDTRRLYFLPYYNKANHRQGFSFYRSGEPLPVDDLPPVSVEFAIADRKATSVDLEVVAENWKRRASLKPYGKRLTKALSGQVFAQVGERETMTFALADKLARELPGVEAESLAPYFSQAFNAMNREASGGPTVEDFVNKMSAQQAFYERQRRAESENTEVEADQPWVVCHKESYYILAGNGQYSGPFTRTSFLSGVERALERFDSFDAWHRRETGAVRKSIVDLLTQYGRVADDVIYDLSAQRSSYDPSKEVLVLARCPLRQIEPCRDEAIDAWIDTFSDPEALRRWLGALTYLDEPAAALYLSGPPGAGKSLLAEGIARLWTDQGGATEAGAVTGSWNSRLLDCPFVFADEKLPEGLRGNSARLRSFLQQRQRTLSMKYAPEATIRGSVRLMLAANNLGLLLSREALSADDVRAIAQRFIHVVAGDETVQYLIDWGGPKAVNKWVTEDRIAAHCLALKEDYPPDRTTRWLVKQDEETAEQFAIWLAVSSGNRDTVCNAIVVASKRFKPGRVKDGLIAVKLSDVTKWWADIDTRRTPTPLALSNALQAMSGRVRGDEFFVRREFVEEWNKTVRAVDPDVLAKRLDACA